MAWITFGTLTSPQSAGLTLDAQFANVAALGAIPCTATGTNAIALTPGANTPPITSYPDLQPSFVFVAQSTSTGAVTINVAGVGARNAYKWNGLAACAAGDVQAGGIYRATPLQSLNSGSGGFVLDSVGVANNFVDVQLIIDGAGNPITTGNKGKLRIPFGAQIGSWQVMADQAGSIVIDVFRNNGGVPTVSMIGGGNKPTLSSSQYSGVQAVSGWTSIIFANNDWLEFSVVSAATVTRVTVDLVLTKL